MAIPSSSIGQSSSFEKLNKNNYTAETREKINLILKKDRLLKTDTCTTVMQKIVKTLCGVEYISNPQKGTPITPFSADGVYTLVLNFGADLGNGNTPQLWEHGMAFQKTGKEIILYQGWVGKFTLGDWLEGKSIGVCHPMLSYSPANSIGNHIENFIQKLDELQNSLNSCKDNVQFAKSLCELFMSTSDAKKDCAVLAMARQTLGELQFHWKYFPFTGAPTVETKAEAERTPLCAVM